MAKMFLGYIVTWHCSDKDRKRARRYALANTDGPTEYYTILVQQLYQNTLYLKIKQMRLNSITYGRIK